MELARGRQAVDVVISHQRQDLFNRPSTSWKVMEARLRELADMCVEKAASVAFLDKELVLGDGPAKR